MNRYYLSYVLILKEPAIFGKGSQLGNVIETHDFVPGSTILGLCASLYSRENLPVYDSCHKTYHEDFRALFLSDKTIYSPAYPLADNIHETFPIPLSVFGCKYYGSNNPANNPWKRHGFRDYLLAPERISEECQIDGCRAPLEHKTGFCYWDYKQREYRDHEVAKEIHMHNRVADTEEGGDKDVFGVECLKQEQAFYGEIAFSEKDHCEIIYDLLSKYQYVNLGRSKQRGKGSAYFMKPVRKDNSFRESLSALSGGLPDTNEFYIYLFSDAIIVDRHLNYCSSLDSETLAYWLGVHPADLQVHCSAQNGKASFYKTGTVMGFNRHRGMPLPMEQTIVKGSVFSVSYTGGKNIEQKLKKLQENGIGLRRNEGFGMVVINHKIHYAFKEQREEASGTGPS